MDIYRDSKTSHTLGLVPRQYQKLQGKVSYAY